MAAVASVPGLWRLRASTGSFVRGPGPAGPCATRRVAHPPFSRRRRPTMAPPEPDDFRVGRGWPQSRRACTPGPCLRVEARQREPHLRSRVRPYWQPLSSRPMSAPTATPSMCRMAFTATVAVSSTWSADPLEGEPGFAIRACGEDHLDVAERRRRVEPRCDLVTFEAKRLPVVDDRHRGRARGGDKHPPRGGAGGAAPGQGGDASAHDSSALAPLAERARRRGNGLER